MYIFIGINPWGLVLEKSGKRSEPQQHSSFQHPWSMSDFTKEVLSMTTIMRYDPLREALSLRNALDQLFEQSFVRPNWSSSGVRGAGVPMDISEDEQGYQVRV